MDLHTIGQPLVNQDLLQLGPVPVDFQIRIDFLETIIKIKKRIK